MLSNLIKPRLSSHLHPFMIHPMPYFGDLPSSLNKLPPPALRMSQYSYSVHSVCTTSVSCQRYTALMSRERAIIKSTLALDTLGLSSDWKTCKGRLKVILQLTGTQRAKIAKKVHKPPLKSLHRVACFFWHWFELWVPGWKRKNM